MLKTIFGYTFAGVFYLMIAAVPIYGVYEMGRSLSQSLSYFPATGVAIDCHSKYTGKKTKYAVRVRVETIGEHPARTISSRWYGSRSSCRENVGDTYPVLIDPDSRDGGVINSFVERWLLPLLVLSIPALFVWGWVNKRWGRVADESK